MTLSDHAPTKLPIAPESEQAVNDEVPSVRRRFPIVPAVIFGLLLAVGVGAWAWGRRNAPAEYFERGRQALRERRDADALAAAELLAGQPAWAHHRRFLRGAALLKQRKYDEAIEELQLSSAHPELRNESLVLIGQAFYESARAGNAQPIWEQVLRQDPQCWDAHRWLGALYYDLGAMDLALHHLQQVSDGVPTDARPDRLMGLINKDYERPDIALKHYRETLRRAPAQPDRSVILFEMARCQLKLFDYQEALKTLQECPETSERTILEAEAHLSLGEPELAERALRAALAQDPENKEVLLLKGRMELERGDLLGAVTTLQGACQRFPKDYVVHFKLVQALRRAGKNEEAQRHEQQANSLRDKWHRFSDLHMVALKEPRNAAARLELAELALALDRPDLAQSWFQAVLAIQPDNAAALDQLLKLVPVKQ